MISVDTSSRVSGPTAITGRLQTTSSERIAHADLDYFIEAGKDAFEMRCSKYGF